MSGNLRDALDAAEKAVLDEEEGTEAPVPEESDQVTVEDAKPLPDWAKEALGDIRVPEGRQVLILRFRAALTTAPKKGDRTCVVWSLSVKDERFARQRTFGDSMRTYEEMTKGMIRAIDGKAIDPKHPAQVDDFYEEIGPKFRGALSGVHQKLHSLDDAERLAFFVQDVAVRTAV